MALCLLLTAGIGYNIGRISALHAAPPGMASQAVLYATSKPKGQPQKPTPTPMPADSRVVASKAAGSKLYHHPWCSGAKRIKEANKLWFSTENEAIAAGYTLAANCQ